jgi:hypothetical protein
MVNCCATYRKMFFPPSIIIIHYLSYLIPSKSSSRIFNSTKNNPTSFLDHPIYSSFGNVLAFILIFCELIFNIFQVHFIKMTSGLYTTTTSDAHSSQKSFTCPRSHIAFSPIFWSAKILYVMYYYVQRYDKHIREFILAIR